MRTVKAIIDGVETLLHFEYQRGSGAYEYWTPDMSQCHVIGPSDIRQGAKFRVNGHTYEIVEVKP